MITADILYTIYNYIPSFSLNFTMSLMILSTKEKATPIFLSFPRKASEFIGEFLDASYFKYANSFNITAISTLDDSKTSSINLDEKGEAK